jgi:hypothetical protein
LQPEQIASNEEVTADIHKQLGAAAIATNQANVHSRTIHISPDPIRHELKLNVK